MRIFLLAVLVTGCSEHGSSPPDAFTADGKQFLDAPVTTCFAPDGSASVTASPSSVFGRIYAGGVLLAGPFAPAKSAAAPFALQLLITNVAEADLSILGCDGFEPSCTTDGLAVTGTLERDEELGSHAVTIRRTVGSSASLDGAINVTEFVHPFLSLPGHITGTISAVSPTSNVSGSFSTVFCPPFLTVTI
jgi:hypothetical protein